MKIKFWNTKYNFYMDDSTVKDYVFMVDHNGKVVCYDKTDYYSSVSERAYCKANPYGDWINISFDCEADVRVEVEY